MNLIERLKELVNKKSDEVLDELDYIDSEYCKELRCEFVEKYGGENMGSTYYYIVKDLDTGKFYRIDGYYSSYDGVDWGDWDIYEVEQKLAQSFEYVKVKN